MTIHAQWIISESALHNLSCAGLTIGWLKAWVRSAGAESVSIYPLESSGWQNEAAQWRIFFADEMELVHSAQMLGLKLDAEHEEHHEAYDTSPLLLENPQRICWSYRQGSRSILFISPGDIAYQRGAYLKHINGNKPLLRLALFADERGEFALEPGLSGSVLTPQQPLPEFAINTEGQLLEEQVVDLLRQRKLRLRTAESCTSGAIAACIGRLPGASDVLDRSWVTYSNEAKIEELGVTAELIEEYGAVSAEVVSAMAEGAMVMVASASLSAALKGLLVELRGSRLAQYGLPWHCRVRRR